MDAELVNTAIQTPPPGEAAPPSTEPITSVAEHAAQFDPKRPEPPTEGEPEPEKPRYRAKSQRASAEDVPRIHELTKKLRDAERERDEWKSKVAAPVLTVTPPTAPPPASRAAVPDAPTAKPTWKAFEDEIGTKYSSWSDAQDAYADARDAWREHDRQQQQVTQQQSAAHAAAIERDRQAIVQHQSRMQTFAEKTPDFTTVTAELMQRALPNALLKAIATHDNGPAFVYHLAQHPDDVDDLFVASHGRSPDDDEFVATLQRRLLKLSSSAAPIASVPGVPHVPAPRPPNAMRTAPMKTGDDPPADGHSLAEHARAYGPKRR